ncbi:hypothetical protein SEVIR_4G201700v4 [Setaria viridis]|uniref:Uncharacterized protein n=1 Tax=Setaria viridis TaxID=4556 RepID=A0A4U6UZ86_SETVI|nr:hypothetical protein SEVIR_4G201700v2 [Setaria viridis]
MLARRRRRIAKHAAAHPDSRVGRRAGGASQAVKQTVVAVSPPASPAGLPVLRRLLPRPLNPCCPTCSLSADACRPGLPSHSSAVAGDGKDQGRSQRLLVAE